MAPDIDRNNLALSTSPYLLQHADNPVHWQMWSAEALAAAQAADKPILLSVGYAACHWCHVMAHESFEDDATAAVMNELFVNIKVDREERPDIDTIYMTALHMLGEQGGWPLTMFLTPEGRPFWGGTYFPPESRYGRPGFTDVLKRVREVYDDDREAILTNAGKIADALAGHAQLKPSESRPQITPNLLDQVGERLLQEVDPDQGGIGGAPKFPQIPAFELIWRRHLRTGDVNARHAVLNTLVRMSQGGIYDHLGGGFARYSVDAEWLVPHFEKMLYDNSALMMLMSQVWRRERLPILEQRVRETAEWLLREMIAENGAFASTLDADSEGEEGKFYVWSKAEVEEVLDADEAALFCRHYDITEGGNFEGMNIPNRRLEPDLKDPETEARLDAARAKLLARRAGRIRPGWDDKVLADWNGMMIAAMTEAGMTFGEPGWIEAAARAFDAVRRDLDAGNGRLWHAWRRGSAQNTGMLDDYAGMIRGALALFEATGDNACVGQAVTWAETLDAHFRDPASGAWFMTADDAEALIVRTLSLADNATPNGNGVMIENLSRLWRLTGDAGWRERLDAVAGAVADQITRNFFPVASALNGIAFDMAAQDVVVMGEPGAEDTVALLAAVTEAGPDRLLIQVAPGGALPDGHPAHGRSLQDGRATAWVCREMVCGLPITDPKALATELRGG
ncbi:MAG: thioredoxin domain-containing protein [Minwuia sp.]|uniref:thioredoxin domain-containing protein n=1 Tax=Minwuia sp. TaxID=2493630 RepID=UPI003A8C5251